MSKLSRTFEGLGALRRTVLRDQNQVDPILTQGARRQLAEIDPYRPVVRDALGETLGHLWRRSVLFAEQPHGHIRRATLRLECGSPVDVYLHAKPDETGRPVLVAVTTQKERRKNDSDEK